MCIETLFAKLVQEDHRRVIYQTIEQIVDGNRDGSVSPYEFGVFLKFFGPLEKAMETVCKSIDQFETSPAKVHAWFCWRSMDRKDVNDNLGTEDGTFVIRCSSQPGILHILHLLADDSIDGMCA